MARPKIMFDERDEEQPIEFAGDNEEVYEGCLVDLEQNGARITARVPGGDAIEAVRCQRSLGGR